jgi:hypothetical protein
MGCALAGPAEIRAGAWKIVGFQNGPEIPEFSLAAGRSRTEAGALYAADSLDRAARIGDSREFRSMTDGIRVSDGGRGGRDQGPGARPANGWRVRSPGDPTKRDRPGCHGRQRPEQRAILAALLTKCAQLSRQMQVTAGAPNFGDLSLASGIGRIVLHANYCARQLPKDGYVLAAIVRTGASSPRIR